MRLIANILCVAFSAILFGTPVYAQPASVSVTATQLDNSFDSASQAKLNEAISMLSDIFNSEKFAQKILHAQLRFANRSQSRVDIFTMVVTGMNDINSSKDGAVTIKVKLFDEYAGHGNFGITDMETRETRTHRCYVLNNDVKCYASHLAHEYMHQIGFLDKKRFVLFGTKDRSVPYVVGDIVDELLDNKSKCVAIEQTCNR